MDKIQPSSGTKRKLHVLEGIANYIASDDLYQVIKVTLTNILDILKSHCGYYSTNALIVVEQGLGSDNANVFTKDGISILDNIEFVSPIQTYIKELITYIGRRVDSAAHDGTTTSMMIASLLVLKYLQDIEKETFSQIELREYVKAIEKDIDKLLAFIELDKATLEELVKDGYDETEARSKIAYSQAMLSSKGDVALADSMREIFANTPKELYSEFTYRRDGVESDVPYRVEYPESDFEVEVWTTSNKHFNHAMGTELLLEGASLIVADSGLVPGYSEVEELLEYIDNTPKDKDLVILYSEISSDIIRKLDKYPNVYLFAYRDRLKNHTYPELKAIAACAYSQTIADSMKSRGNIQKAIIDTTKIHFKLNTLYLSGLYEIKEDDIVHPLYKQIKDVDILVDVDEQQTEYYMKLIDGLKSLISKLKNSHSIDVQSQLVEYIRIYKSMISSRLPTLVVSGKTMDNHANNTVVEDVLGAITSSLEDGFCIDGNFTLLRGAKLSKTSNHMVDATKELLSIIHQLDKSDIDDIFEKLSNFTRRGYFDSINRDTKDITEYELGSGVVQPYVLYKELLIRLKEVLPKLLLTTNVIVPGTVNTND